MRLDNDLHSEGAASGCNRSPAQREAVLAELKRIVDDPIFKKSQRCVALLGAMVEHALAGDSGGLKERTLAVEVFGRESDYDSNADPIVRMTASEIRKRLAVYYQQNNHAQGVRIQLDAGNYIPRMEFLQGDASTPSTLSKSHEGVIAPGALANAGRSAWGRLAGALFATTPRRWMLLAAMAAIGVAVSLGIVRSHVFSSTQYLLWRPLLESREPLVICVADNSQLEGSGRLPRTAEEKRAQLETMAAMIEAGKAPGVADAANFNPTTPFEDANVAHLISTWLQQHGQPTVLRASSQVTLESIRNKPVILVGGLDNPWTAILLSTLRFSPRVDLASEAFWIRDAKNPSNHDWTVKVLDDSEAHYDYAVISRIEDSETGGWVLAVGGLGKHGTEAASRLLIDSAYSRILPAAVRSAGNFQIVVRTNKINGNTGSPQIVGFTTW
jgi:hypothetical protein